MDLTIGVYNVEWMKKLFHTDGTPKDADEDKESARSPMLAAVIGAMDPDVLCIVEGPDTLKDETKTASGQLLAWTEKFGLPGYGAVHGFPSPGSQELCALFKSDVVTLSHAPEQNAAKNPFDQPFLVETPDTLVKEQYKHYRPPFEVLVEQPGGGELARIIVAHTKSKGVFDNVDLARFEQLSAQNRKKLYAECYSIRERCDQWLDADPGAKVFVVGDINDGFGLDYYEQRFSRSAVEILLGDVWEPDKILKHVLPRPRIGKYGWTPSTSSFVDKVTDDRVNVLIDHVLTSLDVDVVDALAWNPYLDDAPQQVKDLRNELKGASDHFPVSVHVTGL